MTATQKGLVCLLQCVTGTKRDIFFIDTTDQQPKIDTPMMQVCLLVASHLNAGISGELSIEYIFVNLFFLVSISAMHKSYLSNR